MLRRRIGLLQAVALNMAMMVGVGPFITIPDFLKTLGGPQAMIGWIIGALVAVADGMVWSELAAAFPGSGGTYHYYDAVYRDSLLGRSLKFLFIWQFLFSGPLELASGAIGFAQYAGFLHEPLKQVVTTIALPWGAQWTITRGKLLAVVAVAAIVLLAYRKIEHAGRLMILLWAGMLVTVLTVIVSGLTHFNAAQVFTFPPGAFTLDGKFAFGLGAALAIAMYDYLGYYQVCYLGDEVANPARTLPLAILISAPAVALIYLTMNISMLGVLPFDKAMNSQHIASDFMFARFGPAAANLLTLLILWTASASLFAGMLSYSRVPYAAARAGHFFRPLAATHPRDDFPHRSLLLVGAISAVACLFDLVTVIEALLTSRILIQFVGQIITVFYIRSRPNLRAQLSYRMWLFPLPALIALAGWFYVFGAAKPATILYGLGSMLLGLIVFAIWDARRIAPSPSTSARTDQRADR
jgi:amino acid transporter